MKLHTRKLALTIDFADTASLKTKHHFPPKIPLSINLAFKIQANYQHLSKVSVTILLCFWCNSSFLITFAAYATGISSACGTEVFCDTAHGICKLANTVHSSYYTVCLSGCDVPNSYGYELALCLDKQGYTVFAGCTDCNSVGARSLASRGTTRLAILQIDVTKQEEIDDAKEMVEDLVGDEGLRILHFTRKYCLADKSINLRVIHSVAFARQSYTLIKDVRCRSSI